MLVARLLAAQGEPASSARLFGSVRGVVFDSIANAPLAGAEVQLLRDDGPGARELHTATSDARGRFAVADLRPGSYAVGFFHPRLDAIGMTAPVLRVAIEGDRSADVILAVPSLVSLARSVCHSTSTPEDVTLWVGVVRDAASQGPRPSAAVSVQWAETDITQGGIHSVRRSGVVRSDAEGRFTVCNAPADANLFVRAAEGRDTSGVVVFRFPADRLLARDVYVGHSEPATADSLLVVDGQPRAMPVLRRGSTRLTGFVRASSGSVLVGARVQVVGASATVLTGADGRFELGGLPAGSWMLDVRHIGYEPARADIVLLEGVGAANTKSMVLEKAATTLEVVRVLAGPSSVLVERGFIARQQSGVGHFIDRDAILRQHAAELQDVVRDLPGMLVMPHVPGGGPTLLMKVNGGVCAPGIWIDGQRFNPDDAQDLLALIDPATVVGVEIYSRPGQVPLTFGGTMVGGCGVIVVWTDAGRRSGARPPK